MFKKEEYNGSVPNLISRPASWTKVGFINPQFFGIFFKYIGVWLATSTF